MTTPLRIPAVYMRGGTSKGVFFLAGDLPADAALRDRILLRVVGSPDRYGKQIDGMGGATSSTSKVVIIAPSQRADSDVDYWFGQVAIDRAVIDWSGNCGNLSAAVGPFALTSGLVKGAPRDGIATVRIWQANIGKRILSHVPMQGGEVVEDGDFHLDGVTFPAAEVRLEFLDPAADEGDGEGGAMFPSGQRIDTLAMPGLGRIEATLINAGNPTIFIAAESIGLRGTELQKDVNGNASLLQLAETIRAHGSLAMKLVDSLDAAHARGHTPKLAFIAKPQDYVASDGSAVSAGQVDLVARIFSMGQLHHAMTGTGAVAIAAAAAIPGTLVNRLAQPDAEGRLTFGHPSGTLALGAEAVQVEGEWQVRKVLVSRSARRLMEGWVRVPG